MRASMLAAVVFSAATVPILFATPVAAWGTCTSPQEWMNNPTVARRSGTVYDYEGSDWYRLLTHHARVILQPGVGTWDTVDEIGADADLYIWDLWCSTILCSSVAGSSNVDECEFTAPASGLSWNIGIEVRYYSDNGNGDGGVQYQLAIITSPVSYVP